MFSKKFCIVLALLLFAGSAAAHTVDEPYETALIAGQNTEAGSVLIWNDTEFVYVKYVAAEGWLLQETHAETGLSLEAIPQTSSGNPVIGKFSQGEEHNPAVQEHLVVFSLEEIGAEPGDDVFIAAHAVLVSGQDPEIEETGWGQGPEFPGKSWAMYIEYYLQPKLWDLPDGLIQARFYHPGPEPSYFRTELSGVPGGFDVFNGDWPGWCVDQTYFVYDGFTYNVMLYSTYDPLLASKCPRCADEDWDMVNYILNHKIDYPTFDAVQQAVWFFVNGGEYPTIPEAQQMVEEALANGEGFVPLEGQYGAIILDPGLKIQLTIIEVDP